MKLKNMHHQEEEIPPLAIDTSNFYKTILSHVDKKKKHTHANVSPITSLTPMNPYLQPHSLACIIMTRQKKTDLYKT